MLRRFRPRLTYANVMVTILAFIVLGGGAYAAFRLPRNSVRSKNIVNGQVKSVDLAKEATFKSAGLANDATSDCSSTPNQWASLQPGVGPVGYQRDQLGYVHLSGVAERCGTPAPVNNIFSLPAGYRPKPDVLYPAVKGVGPGAVEVQPDGHVVAFNTVDGDRFTLNAISFRCAPSGKNGCP